MSSRSFTAAEVEARARALRSSLLPSPRAVAPTGSARLEAALDAVDRALQADTDALFSLVYATTTTLSGLCTKGLSLLEELYRCVVLARAGGTSLPKGKVADIATTLRMMAEAEGAAEWRRAVVGFDRLVTGLLAGARSSEGSPRLGHPPSYGASRGREILGELEPLLSKARSLVAGIVGVRASYSGFVGGRTAARRQAADLLAAMSLHVRGGADSAAELATDLVIGRAMLQHRAVSSDPFAPKYSGAVSFVQNVPPALPAVELTLTDPLPLGVVLRPGDLVYAGGVLVSPVIAVRGTTLHVEAMAPIAVCEIRGLGERRYSDVAPALGSAVLTGNKLRDAALVALGSGVGDKQLHEAANEVVQYLTGVRALCTTYVANRVDSIKLLLYALGEDRIDAVRDSLLRLDLAGLRNIPPQAMTLQQEVETLAASIDGDLGIDDDDFEV